MEEGAGIQDWELLGSPGGAPAAFLGIEGDSDGAIKSDYFALGSENQYGRRASSDGDREGDSPADSDNPSWVDPDSDSRFLGEPSRGDPGFANPGGFWTSDESSDGQESPPPPPPPPGHAKGGPVEPESALEVANSNGEGVQEGWDLGGVEETDVVGAGSEESGELGSGLGRNARVVPDPAEEDSDLGNQNDGGKARMVWWKLPMELLKFCAFRIRPVWSISIVAALVGIIMLGRRLYKKKAKSKGFQLKVSVDGKKVSQFRVQAARLNEAFSVVKRVPMIRSTFPTAGVTPWPVVALR